MFNIFAIDDTTLQIPDTLENMEYFGCKSNQSNTKTALASSSALYDVLNDIVIDATISTFPADERGSCMFIIWILFQKAQFI